MKKQLNVYFPIAFSLIIIGILMLMEIFSLKSYQMNAINIGAAILTLSSVMVGSNIYKRTGSILLISSNFFLYLGIILVFLGFLLPGFQVDFWIINFFSKFDTNPLVLICLGITVASIVQFEDFLNNSLAIKERELQLRVEILEREKLDLKQALQRANSHIKRIQGEKNE